MIKEKLDKWSELSQDLQRIKVEEMKLRKEICAELLRGEMLPAKKKEIIEGYEVEVKQDVSRKLDTDVVNQIYEDLTPEEKGALKFELSIIAKYYKKLPLDCMLQHAITEKPAAPILKIFKL